MKKKEILDLIETGENLTTEFKLRFSGHDKTAKELIAFANTCGGVLIFGVDDNKKIIGVESEKEIISLVTETTSKYCEPAIELKYHCFEIDGKEIVAFEVAESKTKPHRAQDYKNEFDINSAQVFVRVNDKSVQASKEMMRIFKVGLVNQNLKKYSIGQLEKLVFSFLEKKETISVNELCEAGNISQRRASRTLVKMVRAGLLLIHTRENGEDYFTSVQ